MAKESSGASWVVPAECNYWGQTTPVAEMFSSDLTGLSVVSYSPSLDSFQEGADPEAEADAGARIARWLRQAEVRIGQITARWRQEPGHPLAARWLRELYYLMREARRLGGIEGALAQEAATMLAWYRTVPLTGTVDEAMSLAAQAAWVIEVEDLVHAGDAAGALARVNTCRALVTHRDLQTELYVLEATAHTALGSYTDALAALAAAEAIAPTAALDPYYSAPDYGPVRAWLEEQLSDSTVSVAPRAEGALLPGSDVRLAVASSPTQPHGLTGTAYPNPFNPATTLRYTLPAAHVSLVVYDVLGRAVARLVDSMQAAGAHEAVFEASSLPSGLYLYRLEAGRAVQTGRLVLIR